MKLKDVTYKNVMSYIEGNYKKLYNRFLGLPLHTQEQVAYRLDKCKDTCVKEGKCKYCGCVPEGKAFVKQSCNLGKVFPDLMNAKEWGEFKSKNNI